MLPWAVYQHVATSHWAVFYSMKLGLIWQSSATMSCRSQQEAVCVGNSMARCSNSPSCQFLHEQFRSVLSFVAWLSNSGLLWVVQQHGAVILWDVYYSIQQFNSRLSTYGSASQAVFKRMIQFHSGLSIAVMSSANLDSLQHEGYSTLGCQ
jgi:hypothetical protein